MTGPRRVHTRAAVLQAELDGERANSAELRRIAAQQAAALATLKRRKDVRAFLALDRHVAPYRDAINARRDRFRTWLNQVKLVSSAIRYKRKMSERRATVATALQRLGPAGRGSQRRSIVIVVDGPRAPAIDMRYHHNDEVLVVATQELDEVPFTPDRLIISPALESAAALIGRGAAAASGDLLCFLAATSRPLEEYWFDRLVEALGGDVVAATPLLLHPERPLHHATPHDLRVRELGLDLTATPDGLPVIRPREAGQPPDPIRPPVDVFAASGTCLLVDRRAFDAVGGLAPLDDLDAATVDLCARLRANGGRVVAVPESMVVDDRPVLSVTQLTSPIDPHGSGWRELISREGPVLLRQVRGGQTAESLNIALTVAAPSYKVAPRWGDWHLAEAFARSLRRLGHAVRAHPADRADDPVVRCSDVHVVLRGARAVQASPGQRHVLWVISHPEAIEPHEYDDADLVLVASPRLAAHIRDRTDTPVEVLLQATDPQRFRPLPPEPNQAHAVAIVAKSRDVVRKAVADALDAGLRPAIYGSGWKELVDPKLIVADYVPNESLPVLYSSIGVLLADHWDAMRLWGVVSNRIFDALSCGTPVISDYLPEVRELFGDAVPMYRDGAELRSLVDAALADPTAARQRAATGRGQVLAAHTFDHRARTFLDALARHELDKNPR